MAAVRARFESWRNASHHRSRLLSFFDGVRSRCRAAFAATVVVYGDIGVHVRGAIGIQRPAGMRPGVFPGTYACLA